MAQDATSEEGAGPRLSGHVLFAAAAVMTLACGLLFFWPARTLPNVDDLFFVPWAMEFAETGRHWNPLLAVQFPDLETYHLQPRLHLIFAGWFFALAGANTITLVVFEFLCYALASFLFALLSYRLNLRLAALFAPLMFAPSFAVAGFRLELTGAVLFLLGLVLLLPLLRKTVQGERAQSRFETGCNILGMALLGCAPLAAPAVFAWSLGAIAVIEGLRLWYRQASFLRIFMEGSCALLLALAVFAVSVEFEFAAFLEQFTYHASRSTGGGVNDEAIFRALIFAAVAGGLFRCRAPLPAAYCLALAVGQGLGAFLHDKALIRNLAASMVFLIAADAVLNARWQVFKAGLFATVFLVLTVNFASFYVFSRDAGNQKAVLSAYRKDLQDGHRVFVDEVMAHHYLDQKTDGALSWTWGGTFPKGRPTGLIDLTDGDVWYVSEYTLRGYLRGYHAVARPIWSEPDYRRVPQIQCLFGRHACNLPAARWSMMRLERKDGEVFVEELGSGAPPRLLEGA
ncbi:hypothetical protein [Labrenzia sp. VG12]|uniref:hypothetical protein n=1 Tax=Labrenzia sp. VG12 TaxID=2021862 RepID=UPI0012FD9535|nr:hypothetical protein [Labrenzia sp. VG12]